MFDQQTKTSPTGKGENNMKETATPVAAPELVMMMGLNGCRRINSSTTTNTSYAVIKLPSAEIVQGKVESWSDYENDKLQITIDGTTYVVPRPNNVITVK